MESAVGDVQTATTDPANRMMQPIDIGDRWIDDIIIELDKERPSTKLQINVTVARSEKNYDVRESGGKIIRRNFVERIPCYKMNEVSIELYGYEVMENTTKRKVQILSKRISLQDGELYSEETYRSDEKNATIKVIFAYSPGGELRERVEEARVITKDQKVVLDKIRGVHRFFEHLDVLCNSVKEIHKYIEGSCNALLLLYRLCEKQKHCRDSARSLVEEMDDLLNYGVERVGGLLKVNPNTRAAFKSIADVFRDVSMLIEDENKGLVRGLLRDALSSRYEAKIEVLRERLKRAKDGLRDSTNLETWKRVLDIDLRSKLESVLKAHYSSGDGCLEGTRKSLLQYVDAWVQGSGDTQTAWIHGHAGSGKSALLNSIAEKLEKRRIPFTYFPCKRDDPELSNLHRILCTIAYSFAEFYDDYRGFASNLVDQPEGRSIRTGNVKKQAELFFGDGHELISPCGYSRPFVHVILVDAFDECRNHRDEGKTITERRALLRFLLDFARKVPWIKVLITSRREPDIDKVLGEASYDVNCIDINDAKWDTDADIRSFIEAKSQEMELGLTMAQIQQLVEKASGLFVWCATVFRYIAKRRSPGMDTIDAILSSESPSPTKDKPFETLYELYSRVLNSAVSDNEDRALIESVLGVIFVSSERQPLSADAIADILYPTERRGGCDRKREWVGNIVTYLFAIVYVEEGTKIVRVCHPSVLDFVWGMLVGSLPATMISEGTTLTSFSVRLEDIHKRVFDGCLIIMGRSLRFNMCGLQDSFQLNKDILDLPARINRNISEALQYGCSFCISHFVQAGSKQSAEKVIGFLNSREALFWVEALSLLNIVDRGIVALQDYALFVTDGLDAADIANEWERFLLAYGDALKSTPHLYLSALSWIPRSSKLWNVVHVHFSSEFPMISNVQKAWNSERWSENVGTEVISVAYSPDGRLFAAGCEDGGVRLWKARSGVIAREPFLTKSDVYSIAFSPDSRLLASGHNDKKIRLWDLRAESTVPRVLEGHTLIVTSVAFSSDGGRIVSGSGDGNIRVWDVESCAAIGRPFKGHDSTVNSVTFSADDTHIISGSFWDETVRIWSSETGEQIRQSLDGRCAACSWDGMLIASGSEDGTIRLWDAQTYKQIGDSLMGHTDRVNSVCFSFDSELIASCSYDQSIRIWSVEAHPLVCVLREHTSYISSVAFAPSGRTLLSGSYDSTVRIWDVKDTVATDRPDAGRSAETLCLSYVPESSLVVSGSSDGSIYCWDVRTGGATGQPLQGHTSAVNALSVSSDSQWLVSGSSDKTLRMWDIASGTSFGEPMFGHTDRIITVAVSHDSQLIASGSDDKTVRLWDVATRNVVKTLEGHEDSVTSAVFSFDGNNLISGSKDETIRIWDTRTGMVVGEPLRSHSSGVTAVAVSADGKWMASGSEDGTLRIWNMPTLSEAHVLKGYGKLSSAAFTPNSKFLISGPYLYRVEVYFKVWDVWTGEYFAFVWAAHTGQTCSLTCSPDGLEFASGSNLGTIRVWDIRACTDIKLYEEDEVDYSELGEEELRIRWNASRARMNDDGWIRDRENLNLLLWVPLQYRDDISGGARLVIGAPGVDTMRPEVDYRKLLRYSGERWTDIYTASA